MCRRTTLRGASGNVSLALDVSRLNHHTALMDMALIVFIVGLLLLFVATLNLTAYRVSWVGWCVWGVGGVGWSGGGGRRVDLRHFTDELLLWGQPSAPQPVK